MTDRLGDLVAPDHTAVLTMELQKGVVGAEAVLPMLRDQVDAVGLLDRVGELCRAARRHDVRVVHCRAENRPDGVGATSNCKIFALNDRQRRTTGSTPIDTGSAGAPVVDELGPEPSDIDVPRIHGLTPFMSTSLDQILRNLGVTTIVATGVSVNLGVMGLCLNAVDLGYDVVLPRDAVTGVPADLADEIIDRSLDLITTVTTTAEVLDRWRSV